MLAYPSSLEPLTGPADALSGKAIRLSAGGRQIKSDGEKAPKVLLQH